MSENDGQDAAGGNSPLKMAIFAVVMILLVGALFWSMNKSKGLKADGLPPAKPVDPNAPKRESKVPDMSALLDAKKAAEAAKSGAAPAEAAPAEAAPAEAAPAEAAPAPAN